MALRILLVILLAMLSTSAVCEPGDSPKMSHEQWRELLQSICTVPVHKDDRSSRSVCDQPRDYPQQTPQEGEASTGRCPLRFLGDSDATRDRENSIYYGHFTKGEDQAIAFYWADCEPHANENGGMILFRGTREHLRLADYFPGVAGGPCVVSQPNGGQFNTAFCLVSHNGQGELEQSFSSLAFLPDKGAEFHPMIEAGNLDGMALGVMTDCPHPKPRLHDLKAARIDSTGTQITLEAAALDPKSVQTACQRYKRNEFSADENEIREISSVAHDMALIRSDENKYIRVDITFDLKKETRKIKYTSIPISNN